MIYADKLGMPAKLTYGDQVVQASSKTIIKKLPLDIDETDMEILLLGVKDVTGFGSKKLVEALQTINDKTIIVYIYSNKDKGNAFAVPEMPNVKAYEVKEVTPQVIKQCVDPVLKSLSVDKVKVTEINVEESKEDEAPKEFIPEQLKAQDEEKEILTQEEPQEEETAPVVEEKQQEVEPVIEEKEEPKSEPKISDNIDYNTPRVSSIEERLGSLDAFGNFGLLKRELQKETIIQEAMRDSSILSGAMDTLAICEKKFFNILQDRTLSTDERMIALRDTARLKTESATQVNNVLVEKMSSIIRVVVDTTEDAVNRQLNELNKCKDLKDATEDYFKTSHELRRLQRNRLDLQLTIAEAIRTMITTYQVLNASVTDTILNFNEGLPSENESVSGLLSLYNEEFNTDKTLALAHKLQAEVKSGALRFSNIEKEANILIESLANLCEVDDKVIDYQDRLIQILSGKSVKDVVVRTHSIQNALQVFVGGSDSGVTTTAMLQSKIQSKVGRTLCVDFRPNSNEKLQQYGLEVMPLREFLVTDYVRDLQFCNYDLGDDVEYLDEVINKLTLKLTDYRFINFIFSDEQMAAFNRIEDKVLALHVIVNSNAKNIVKAQDIVKQITSGNIAKIMILVNPTIEPITMVQRVGVDPLLWKVVQVPYMNEINKCSLEGHAPFDNIILEAYRVALR